MLTLAAVVVAAACSLPSGTHILVESSDPACSTFSICRPGEPIRFRLSSTGSCEEFHWYFGDGTESTEREPVHTYADAKYFPVSLIAGTSQVTEGIDTRPDVYNHYALAAWPTEISVVPGQSIHYAVSKKFLPNPGVFHITCGGALSCAGATIGANERSVSFTATATRPGAGGLFYFTSTIGGRPQGGGPFAMVRVIENAPPPPCIPTDVQAFPERIELQYGQAAELEVMPFGSGTLVQWYAGADPIAGATSAQLRITPPPGTHYYRAVVTNDCGRAESAEWEVVVHARRRRAVR